MTDIDRREMDEAIVCALLEGKSAQQVADAAGVSAHSVTRRLADAKFVSRLQKRQQMQLDQAMRSLTAVGSEAITVLGNLLSSPSEEIRLLAAKTISELLVRLHHGIRPEAESRSNGRTADPVVPMCPDDYYNPGYYNWSASQG